MEEEIVRGWEEAMSLFPRLMHGLNDLIEISEPGREYLLAVAAELASAAKFIDFVAKERVGNA